MIIKDFSNFDSINEGLKSLFDQKNILIINLSKSEEYKKEPVEIEIDYKDKIRRKRKKKVKVENFINFTFSDFKQFSEILVMVENHLI